MGKDMANFHWSYVSEMFCEEAFKGLSTIFPPCWKIQGFLNARFLDIKTKELKRCVAPFFSPPIARR